MKEKYKKLNEVYETIDNNIENCIEESGVFKNRKSDDYYCVVFCNNKYMLGSVYIANSEFKDYYDEEYMTESLEEWLKNSNLQKVINICNFEDIFLENIYKKYETLEEVLNYLIELQSKLNFCSCEKTHSFFYYPHPSPKKLKSKVAILIFP